MKPRVQKAAIKTPRIKRRDHLMACHHRHPSTAVIVLLRFPCCRPRRTSQAMSDFRYDPVFGNWVCIAESRLQRPIEFQQTVQRRPGLDCPFCRGNEDQTPTPLAEQTTGEGWVARAIPNKYPALSSELQPGASCQEVIVIAPRHVVSFSDLKRDELDACMQLFQQRVEVAWNKSNVEHLSLFMNCRPLAGASIEHAHFQLLGSPVCTDQVRDRVRRMTTLDDGMCFWQQETDRERQAVVRIVEETALCTVFCPYASRFTGQLRFAPKGSQPFRTLNSSQLAHFGQTLARWTRVAEQVLDQPAYNIVFYFPPTDLPDGPWFVDLVPRFPQVAGFELATDCWINPLSPETIARQYRNQHDGCD
jgi:UDPglucose--hexose-1-phosphate uridylyltransferase